MSDLKIINFVCDLNDRFSKIAKMIKILKESSCRDISEVRTFVNVCIYYKLWVINFVIIASSIYCLLKNKESLV